MIRALRSDAAVRALLQSIDEGVIVVDATGAPILWNARAERVLGLDELTATGAWLDRPRVYTVDGALLSGDEVPLAKALRGDEVVGAELLLRAPGRAPTLVVTTTRPLRDQGGAVVAAVAVFRELGAEREMARALRESERLYRALANHLPSAAAFLVDRELRFLLAAGPALTGAGVASDELEGKTASDVSLPAVAARYRRALAGETGTLEVERAERVYEMQFAPVYDDGGAIFAALAVTTDVTDERRAARALRDAEEELRLTVEHAPIGMAVVGLDGRWLRVNQALCQIVGYTPAELLARTFRDITHPDDRTPDPAAVDALVRGEIPRYRRAKRYVRKDGSVADVMFHVSVVRAASGEPRHFIAQIEDMTERRRLEAHVRLTDRMASIGTLAAGVAHEINNPLAAVAANLDLLGETIRDLAGAAPSARVRELRELVAEARDGAERIRTIVRGLKTFSRAEAERRVPLDLARVLDVAIGLSMNEIRHRATLERRYGAAPLVDADEARLAQVFINLLVNAAQAIPEGHTSANRVTVTTSTDAEGRAVVEVRDTGAGIPEDARARVFDPFFTTKAVGAGTGLGLSICHGIVDGLGGAITFESTIGEGTVFRVVLPPSRLGAEPEAPPSSRRASLRPRAATLRVLVIDDDPQLGRSIKRVLGAQHDVTLYASGRKALEAMLVSEPFDVILCDLMMPEMTGMDLHAELVARGLDAAERMIFITGGAFTEAGRAFLDTVPNPRLEKPFDLRNLRALVQSYRR